MKAAKDVMNAFRFAAVDVKVLLNLKSVENTTEDRMLIYQVLCVGPGSLNP